MFKLSLRENIGVVDPCPACCLPTRPDLAAPLWRAGWTVAGQHIISDAPRGLKSPCLCHDKDVSCRSSIISHTCVHIQIHLGTEHNECLESNVQILAVFSYVRHL